MSGIAGIIHFDRMPVQPGLIERMTDCMGFRGPDGIRHWVDESVAFGHCLLATTTECQHECQPVVSADRGVALVFDGRIDNAAELRRELRASGVVPVGPSDSELVLHAYDLWGERLTERVSGDFALAIWDARKRRLFCARDRVGNRPFHYVQQGGAIAFASDACALLTLPWVQARLNLDFVAENLAMAWTSVEDTFWQGIRRLPPASRLTAMPDGTTVARYWQPRVDLQLPCRTPRDYVEFYRNVLFDVVQSQGRSSGPVACEVSGGLDSSALFAVAADLQRRGQWPAPDLHGYSLGFRGAGDADEMDYVESVARHLDRPIAEIAPTRQDLGWYEAWALRHGYPAGYPNGVMGLGIRQAARRRKANCLLVGVGGDEWLDGWPTCYAEAIVDGHWRELWKWLVEDARSVGRGATCRSFLRYGIAPVLPTPLREALRSTRRRRWLPEDWLTAPLRQRLQQRRAAELPGDVRAVRVGQRAQILQLNGAYSLLSRESEERLCAWEGLEIRRPFWDTRILEFAFATPERVRWRGAMTRATHRAALSGLLPDTVLSRRSKADFMVVFRRQRDEILTALGRCSSTLTDWVSTQGLERVVRGTNEPRSADDSDWLLWTLFECHALRKLPGGNRH